MMDAKARRLFEGTKKLVLQKMGNGNSCTVIHKSGKEFIFARDCEGWTLYKGCDLIVGDTSLNLCVGSMIDLCVS